MAQQRIISCFSSFSPLTPNILCLFSMMSTMFRVFTSFHVAIMGSHSEFIKNAYFFFFFGRKCFYQDHLQRFCPGVQDFSIFSTTTSPSAEHSGTVGLRTSLWKITEERSQWTGAFHNIISPHLPWSTREQPLVLVYKILLIHLCQRVIIGRRPSCSSVFMNERVLVS